jgi:hypothetical protein
VARGSISAPLSYFTRRPCRSAPLRSSHQPSGWGWMSAVDREVGLPIGSFCRYRAVMARCRPRLGGLKPRRAGLPARDLPSCRAGESDKASHCARSHQAWRISEFRPDRRGIAFGRQRLELRSVAQGGASEVDPQQGMPLEVGGPLSFRHPARVRDGERSGGKGLPTPAAVRRRGGGPNLGAPAALESTRGLPKTARSLAHHVIV